MSTTVGILFGALAVAAGIAIGFMLAKARTATLEAQLAAADESIRIHKEQVVAANSSVSTLKEQIAANQGAQTETVRLATELQAMKKSVEVLSSQAREAELSRVAAEQKIRSDLTNMAMTNKSLLEETTKIAGALSNSQRRGKFGEAQLEQLLQDAGLIEGVHFSRQKSSASDNDKVSIPDITITFPGSSVLFVDSKFPFERFFEAFGTDDVLQREDLLQQHAKDLLKHVDALAKRGYAGRVDSASFVVLFAPFESILTEALRVDTQLLEKAFRKGVTIATPTTMMSLLATVGFVFSRNRLAESAVEIQELAGTFLKNVSSLHAKIVTVGDRLKQTVKAYNDMIPTAESTVLSPAKKIMNLGVSADGTKLKALADVPENVRELKNKLSLEAPDDYIDAEEVEEEI